MTFIQRLRSFFSSAFTVPISAGTAATTAPVSSPINPDLPGFSESRLAGSSPPPAYTTLELEPLPDWLADEENLRDEGILFGLSDSRPDGKIAEIRAHFGQQTAPLEKLLEQYTKKIDELNLLIEQRESLINSLRDQATDLRDREPAPNNLIRTVISLLLLVLMGIGNFYLIDETIRTRFPNRWIAVGVFLAGMFNLFGRTSFFYETDTRLSGRRLVEEMGLPLAASLFVLVQALQTQSVGQSLVLGVFVFFLFLLTGKHLLSTLTTLQTDLDNIRANRELLLNREQNLPVWEARLNQLSREIDAIQAQKWPVVTASNHLEADLTQLIARRDSRITLFLSEFELARSLRDRLTEQQRKLMINYE